MVVQEKEITNSTNFSDVSLAPADGRIIALDLGTKKIGIAVSDETQIAVRPHSVIKRHSWKELLKHIISLINELDARALVLGLPVNFDGSPCEMTDEALRLARNFSLSLSIPVFLQDERLTSYAAQRYLKQLKLSEKEVLKRIDSEAAVIILSDFIDRKTTFYNRLKVAQDNSESDY